MVAAWIHAATSLTTHTALRREHVRPKKPAWGHPRQAAVDTTNPPCRDRGTRPDFRGPAFAASCPAGLLAPARGPARKRRHAFDLVDLGGGNGRLGLGAASAAGLQCELTSGGIERKVSAILEAASHEPPGLAQREECGEVMREARLRG